MGKHDLVEPMSVQDVLQILDGQSLCFCACFAGVHTCPPWNRSADTCSIVDQCFVGVAAFCVIDKGRTICVKENRRCPTPTTAQELAHARGVRECACGRCENSGEWHRLSSASVRTNVCPRAGKRFASSVVSLPSHQGGLEMTC